MVGLIPISGFGGCTPRTRDGTRGTDKECGETEGDGTRGRDKECGETEGERTRNVAKQKGTGQGTWRNRRGRQGAGRKRRNGTSPINQQPSNLVQGHEAVALRFYRNRAVTIVLSLSLLAQSFLCCLFHNRINKRAAVWLHQQQLSFRTSLEIDPTRLIESFMR